MVLIKAGSREAFSLLYSSSKKGGFQVGHTHHQDVGHQEQQHRHGEGSRQGDDDPQKQGKRRPFILFQRLFPCDFVHGNDVRGRSGFFHILSHIAHALRSFRFMMENSRLMIQDEHEQHHAGGDEGFPVEAGGVAHLHDDVAGEGAHAVQDAAWDLGLVAGDHNDRHGFADGPSLPPG